MSGQVLCADIGTSFLKAALVRSDGALTAFCRRPFRSGEFSLWHDEFLSAREELLLQVPGARIDGICICGNGPTVCTSKGSGILWNERVLSEEIPAGLETRSLFLPRLCALRSRFPQSWGESEFVLSGPEFLAYAITGRAVTVLPESRFASAYWQEFGLEAAGFSPSDIEKLPPFISPASQIGSDCDGVPVFCAGPDYVAAMIGAASLAAGRLCDRAGTSEGINLVTDAPVLAEGLRTLPSPAPGLWNLSFLLPESGRLFESDKDALLEEFRAGLERLLLAARGASQTCDKRLVVTGGQCRDQQFLQRKADATGFSIVLPRCHDTELLGCAATAFCGLGIFSSMREASDALFHIEKVFEPA